MSARRTNLISSSYRVETENPSQVAAAVGTQGV